MGSRVCGLRHGVQASLAAVHGPGCPEACGTLDQGLSLCLLLVLEVSSGGVGQRWLTTGTGILAEMSPPGGCLFFCLV